MRSGDTRSSMLLSTLAVQLFPHRVLTDLPVGAAKTYLFCSATPTPLLNCIRAYIAQASSWLIRIGTCLPRFPLINTTLRLNKNRINSNFIAHAQPGKYNTPAYIRWIQNRIQEIKINKNVAAVGIRIFNRKDKVLICKMIKQVAKKMIKQVAKN